MKKLINSPDTVVTDALAGVAAAHPSLAVDVENKVITRASGPQAGKVGLVSGGGSGHEPMHGGFVGYGMLDAACPGEVFSSPVPDCTSSRTTPATCSTSRWRPNWPGTRTSRSSRW
jgi:dihydroxyacetone kinase-like protein